MISAIRRAGARPGAPSSGVTIGAGAWLGAGAKILDGVSDRRSRDRRRRSGRAGERARRGDRRRHPGRESGRAQRRVTAEAERPPGLRSPRLGGIADARRQAAVQLDDSALRSDALQRVPGQPAEEGPVGGDARVDGRRHLVPAQVEVRSGDADRAAEGDRRQEDRHPAPARLWRHDVRPAGRR